MPRFRVEDFELVETTEKIRRSADRLGGKKDATRSRQKRTATIERTRARKAKAAHS